MSPSNACSPAVATHPLATQIPSLRTLLAGPMPSRRADSSDSLDMPSLEPVGIANAGMLNVSNLFPATSHIWPGVAAGAPSASHSAQSALRTRRSARLAQLTTSAESTPSKAQVDDSSSAPSAARSKKRKPSPAASLQPPTKKTRSSLKKPPPSSVPEEEQDRKLAPEEVPDCTICMCQPDLPELSAISGCDHKFCFSCIAKWADRENTCPLCKSRFTKIHRVNPSKGKKRAGHNSKKVKARDQRSDFLAGGALEGLLASLAASGSLPAQRFNHHFLVAARSNSANAVANGGSFAFTALDELFESEDEEEVSFPHSFINVIMSRPFARGQRSFAANMPRAFAMAPARAAPAFSFPPTDGIASNPLEIDDDSDEEDDFVEVVEVARST